MKKRKLLESIALKIASHPKTDDHKKRVVVVTCGTEPTVCAVGDEVFLVPLESICEPSRVVDTSGARDTFLGGLFAQLLLDDSLKDIFENGEIDLMEKAIK